MLGLESMISRFVAVPTSLPKNALMASSFPAGRVAIENLLSSSLKQATTTPSMYVTKGT